MWILVWLTGVVVIAWTGLNYAAPRFEHKLQMAVQESIAAFNSDPMAISAKGREVTLTGEVGSKEEKKSLLTAANLTPGVAKVNAQITIIEASTKPVSPSNEAPLNATVQADNSQSSTVVAQATSLPTEQTHTSTPQTTEKQDTPSAEDVLEVVNISTTRNESNSAKQAPSINISVLGNVLSIEGRMSDKDDTSSLINNALDSFNLQVVSNGLLLNGETDSAEWLNPLNSIVSRMGDVTDAKITIADGEITLAGVASTNEVRDEIIEQTLASINNFTLNDSLKTQADDTASSESTNLASISADANSTDNTVALAEEQTQPAAEATANAEAAEQAQLTAEATKMAAAVKKAQLEAEEQAEAEAIAKEQAEEQARLDAEAAAKAEKDAQLEAEEQARLAAEAAAKAEKEAQLEAEEQARLAAETTANANEDARQAAIDEAKARAAERIRLAAETVADATSQTSAATAPRSPRLETKSEESVKPESSTKTPANGTQGDLKQALQNLPSLRILFETEGNKLTSESLDILKQIAQTIIQHPDTQVIIEGHTDATGDPEQNLQLSLLRATTVRDYLIQQGVSVYNLRAIGVGEAVPLVPNDTPEGRAKNRRIEFTFR